MKLINKILAVVAPAATIAAITPIALTSCGNDSKTTNTITYTGTKTQWTSPGSSITLTFKLGKVLEAGQKLKGPLFPDDWQLHNADFDGDTEWTINGTNVTGVQKFKNYQSHIGDASITVNKLKFAVWDKNERDVCYTIIENFKVSW